MSKLTIIVNLITNIGLDIYCTNCDAIISHLNIQNIFCKHIIDKYVSFIYNKYISYRQRDNYDYCIDDIIKKYPYDKLLFD